MTPAAEGHPGRDLIVGIDAGGSKTLSRAFDADGGMAAKVVAGVELAGIDLPVLGEVETGRRLAALRRELESRLPHGARVISSVVGAPGFGELPRWTDTWQRLVDEALDGWSPSVHNDVRLAFYSAFPDGEGILVLAGTGSMAWGGRDGQEIRCGGWGPWFGDEGSAYDIARQALRAAASAIDGRGPATTLVETLPRSVGATDLWGLLDQILTAGAENRPRLARLAQHVSMAAESGDPVAAQLLEEAGRALVAHAVALSRRLSGSPPLVAYAGGAFRSGALTRAFETELARTGLKLSERTITSPVAGALAIALRELARATRRS